MHIDIRDITILCYNWFLDSWLKHIYENQKVPFIKFGSLTVSKTHYNLKFKHNNGTCYLCSWAKKDESILFWLLPVFKHNTSLLCNELVTFRLIIAGSQEFCWCAHISIFFIFFLMHQTHISIKYQFLNLNVKDDVMM